LDAIVGTKDDVTLLDMEGMRLDITGGTDTLGDGTIDVALIKIEGINDESTGAILEITGGIVAPGGNVGTGTVPLDAMVGTREAVPFEAMVGTSETVPFEAMVGTSEAVPFEAMVGFLVGR
jgi:hypothetical protein